MVYILAFSALLVAGNAAFFSVTGISHLFSGAFWSVVCMAGSLEIGKLVTASFLYRYWDKINKLLKIYLLVGSLILVGITSIGIFGYLSKAYQQSSAELTQLTLQLDQYETELDFIKTDKKATEDHLEEQLSSLPDNYITAKRKLRNEYTPMIRAYSDSTMIVSKKIAKLRGQLVETGIDVGPALYVAKAFDTDVDTVVKWLILIFILVFDPLAIALVIATNVAIAEREKSSKEKPKKNSATIAAKHIIPTQDLVFENKEEESAIEKVKRPLRKQPF